MRRVLFHAVFAGPFLLSVLLVAGCGGQSGQSAQAPAAATAVVAQPNTGSETTSALPAGATRLTFTPGQNEARYRVREQLVNVSLTSDAVGSTREVTGAIVIGPDGAIVSAQSEVTVNLSTLTSDENRRDNFLRRNTLQTDRYPVAKFVPLEARGLPSPLPGGGDVAFQLVGNLTIRDVTQQVAWEVAATVDGDQLAGQAKTSFTFADFKIAKPQVPVILGVEDDIRLEIDFHLRKG